MHCIVTLANFQNSLSTLAPASIDKSACSPAGIMSPGLGPAELLRNCLLDWAPSGANKKLPPGLGPGSFLKKLQWGAVFLCQIEYGYGDTVIVIITIVIISEQVASIPTPHQRQSPELLILRHLIPLMTFIGLHQSSVAISVKLVFPSCTGQVESVKNGSLWDIYNL